MSQKSLETLNQRPPLRPILLTVIARRIRSQLILSLVKRPVWITIFVSDVNFIKLELNPTIKRTNHSSIFLFKGTPETDLFDYPPDIFDERSLLPDLKIMCKICKVHLSLSELNDHKQFHEALTTLGLKYLPETENGLRDRRAQLVKSTQSKYLKKSKDFNSHNVIDWNAKVKRINNAYELIKSYVNNTFEQNRRVNNATRIKLDSYGKN